MIETLKKFCPGPDGDQRASIATPWSIDEYSLATNGHVIIRVPRLADVPENPKAPLVDEMWKHSNPTEWISLADVEFPKPITVECSECNGEKEIKHEDCPDCDGHPCEECGGTGRVTPMQPVQVGNTHYQLKYLLLLKALPNCRIAPNADTEKQGAFTFDGGDGLLMPMKPFGEWRKV